MADELDRLIDSSLAARAEVEPRDGLPDRVLGGLLAEKPRSSQTWLFLLVPGAACLLLLLKTPQPVPENPVIREAPPLTSQLRFRSPKLLVPVRASRPHVRKKQSLPKLDVFPTSSAMTAEERVLAAFVARDPTAAAKYLAQPADDPTSTSERPNP